MKKILIFSHAMEIGGAERALLGVLESIDYSKYSVDLFLMRHTGELLKYIPNNVKLLPEIKQYTSLAVPIEQVIKGKQLGVACGRLIGKFKAKQTAKLKMIKEDGYIQIEYSHKYTKFAMPKIAGEYDLAISFLTPHYFVSEKVNAKKKIAWIHTDYTKIKIDVESEEKMWDKYDNIISISEAVTESFLSVFPKLKDKIVVIQNIMPIQSIKQQLDEIDTSKEMSKDATVKLLSVGRFCEAKNFDNVPHICKMIREQGIDVKWYLIGYGGDEHLIRKKIDEFEMQEHVIILGKKENPYPYIKACDIYVQPSRYEGNAVTVREAQMLNKPVVITNYTTAKSQLRDGVDGLIAKMDNESCANKIVEMIKNEQVKQMLVENTKKHDYTNVLEAQKLYKIIDGN